MTGLGGKVDTARRPGMQRLPHYMRLYEESLGHHERLGDLQGKGATLAMLGQLLVRSGKAGSIFFAADSAALRELLHPLGWKLYSYQRVNSAGACLRLR